MQTVQLALTSPDTGYQIASSALKARFIAALAPTQG
jgi:hypothetical protein